MLEDPPTERSSGGVTSEHKVSVAADFSRFPAGRYRSDGPAPGEAFRDDHLVPALKKNARVVVLLDGTLGYGSSFLEEAFGGLVRRCNFSAKDLHQRLVLESRDRTLIAEIWQYIDTAKQGNA
jgi:hypothetical protein